MSSDRGGRGKRATFDMPAIPAEDWCFSRRLFEDGKTLVEIGEIRGCDPRTIKQCIIANDDMLNHRPILKMMDRYRDIAEEWLQSDASKVCTSVRQQARALLLILQQDRGFEGSERTVRTFLCEHSNKQTSDIKERE